MKQDGRKNFIRMIEQISKGNNSEAVNIIAELGTMKAGGVLPDSYPEGSEPDDDYLVLSGIETAEGDRETMPDNLFPEEYDNDEEYLDDEENEGTDEENTEEDEDAGYKPSIFFDFDTGDFVTLHDGKLKEASGFEAWVQWCYKTIMTQRYAHEGYSKVPCKQIAVKRQKAFYKERLKRR